MFDKRLMHSLTPKSNAHAWNFVQVSKSYEVMPIGVDYKDGQLGEFFDGTQNGAHEKIASHEELL